MWIEETSSGVLGVATSTVGRSSLTTLVDEVIARHQDSVQVWAVASTLVSQAPCSIALQTSCPERLAAGYVVCSAPQRWRLGASHLQPNYSECGLDTVYQLSPAVAGRCYHKPVPSNHQGPSSTVNHRVDGVDCGSPRRCERRSCSAADDHIHWGEEELERPLLPPLRPSLSWLRGACHQPYPPR